MLLSFCLVVLIDYFDTWQMNSALDSVLENGTNTEETQLREREG